MQVAADHLEKDQSLIPYLATMKELVEAELSSLVSSLTSIKLQQKIGYALLSDGKRLRPLMVMLSAQSVGGDREQVLKLSLAFELLHTATLVHDDLLDRDKVRRDAPALHEKWSANEAILVGDALIALSINLASGYGSEIMKRTSEAGLMLCDGEYMDELTRLDETSEDEYFEKIRKKSASLFQAAAQCGAMAGGGKDKDVKSLTDYGEHFGIAYQLIDDLLDSTSAKDGIPKDLRRGRISLPLIHLYQSSSVSEREVLLKDLQVLADDNFRAKQYAHDRVMQALIDNRSIYYCQRKASEYVSQSVVDLAPLVGSKFKGYLTQMAKTLEAEMWKKS